MIDLLQRLLPRSLRQPTPVPDALWQSTLSAHPFLSALNIAEQDRLRLLCTHFLAEKEFHGANGLTLTDPMALAIAAQACFPLLHMHGTSGEPVRDPLKLLDWYGDFVGIVVQPGAVVARRKTTDGAGVVHHYNEVLAGEAMDRGPLMLSWEEVAHASVAAESGSNVVIHEFVHKMTCAASRWASTRMAHRPCPKVFWARAAHQTHATCGATRCSKRLMRSAKQWRWPSASAPNAPGSTTTQPRTQPNFLPSPARLTS